MRYFFLVCKSPTSGAVCAGFAYITSVLSKGNTVHTIPPEGYYSLFQSTAEELQFFVYARARVRANVYCFSRPILPRTPLLRQPNMPETSFR